MHVYDGNRRLLGVGDVYPEEAQLQKGDHTIRVRLRHDDPKILEGLRDLPLVVERKLKDPLTVPVYATHSDAVTGSNAVKDFVVCPGALHGPWHACPTHAIECSFLYGDMYRMSCGFGFLCLSKST